MLVASASVVVEACADDDRGSDWVLLLRRDEGAHEVEHFRTSLGRVSWRVG